MDPVEHGPPPLEDDPGRVAAGKVVQDEQARVGLAAHLRRLARRAVLGLGGTCGVLLEERRLVDEDVGAAGGLPDHVAGRGVTGDDDAPSGARLADDVLRAHAADGSTAAQHALNLDCPPSFTARMMGAIQEDPKTAKLRMACFRKVKPKVDGSDLAMGRNEASELPLSFTLASDEDVAQGSGQFGRIYELD